MGACGAATEEKGMFSVAGWDPRVTVSEREICVREVDAGVPQGSNSPGGPREKLNCRTLARRPPGVPGWAAGGGGSPGAGMALQR